MLKFTRYLGVLVLIVSIGGIWFPKLGYFLLLVFASLMIISPFRGRWFCGNLCPRGSFNDFILSKLSFKKKIPDFFRSLWLRIPVLVLLMGFMIFRVIQTRGM
ncbi:4Fe-4S binding protein, partial [Candidatus Woesearchaeota archaeon]|nr:4Fe-4S binding protein [Candidatus Woesearchaeota archaeon]